MKPRKGTALPLLLLVAGALGGGGCASAGLAVAGPLASVASYLLDRGVDRTYAAGLPQVWEATLTTLGRMQVSLEKADRDEQQGQISGAAGGVSLSGEVTKVTGGMTRVALTVSGGIRPDKETAKEILDRVADLLQDDPVALASARAQVRARANLAQPAAAALPTALAAPAAAVDPQATMQMQKELEALRTELAALREFRASLVREFGSLRSGTAARLAERDAPDRLPARLRAVDDGGLGAQKGPQEAPVFRVREAVARAADIPESVFVVRLSAAGLDPDGKDLSSQILRVDWAPSVSRAATPPPVAPIANAGGPLRAAGILAPVPSLILPSADSLSGGSAQPALPQ